MNEGRDTVKYLLNLAIILKISLRLLLSIALKHFKNYILKVENFKIHNLINKLRVVRIKGAQALRKQFSFIVIKGKRKK